MALEAVTPHVPDGLAQELKSAASFTGSVVIMYVRPKRTKAGEHDIIALSPNCHPDSPNRPQNRSIHPKQHTCIITDIVGVDWG